MKDLIELSTQIHAVSVLLTILVNIFLYITFIFLSDYKLLTRKYERYSLVYFFFLSVTAFTGVVLFTVTGFVWSVKIVLMIMALLHMIVTSIKLHMIFKNSRIFDEDSQIAFRKYTRKKYFMDILVLIMIGFISYAIHF
jgi:hypothetical protein